MLRLVALSVVLSATAAAQPSADWRLAVDLGPTRSDESYGVVTVAVERGTPLGVALGGRFTGAGQLFDVSHGPPDSVVALPPDEWYAGDATAAVEASSGAMRLRAQGGVGAVRFSLGQEHAWSPTASLGVGLDVYPVRFLGIGLSAEGAVRSQRSYTRISLGLRSRL